MHLLIGPSNAGKSVWIERNAPAKVVYAFENTGKQTHPETAILHYNLLFQALDLYRSGQAIPEWDILSDANLARSLKQGEIQEATVIVAPIAQLISRAEARDVVEATRSSKGKYPSETWVRILNAVDHFALYQQLFDVLERNSIPYRVLFNDDRVAGDMRETDRCFVHAALRGHFVPVPNVAEIEKAVAEPGAEYQSILLPRGIYSDAKKYEHTNGSRRQSFEMFRRTSLSGASVLDIGCAMGDMLFWYERFGAARLTGLDMNPGRLAAARRFGALLQSAAEFHRGDFLEFDNIEPHDHVLALNVLHHVSDIRGFIAKASLLARKRLIIEYPTLYDPKFGRMFNGGLPDGLDDLPLIGVSGKRVDQTFVFSTAALKSLVAEFGKFEVDIMESPVEHRKIAVFERK